MSQELNKMCVQDTVFGNRTEIFILCHKMLNHANFRRSVEDLLKRSEGYLFAA